MPSNLQWVEDKSKVALYDYLCRDPNIVVVKEWRGWTIRGKEKREKIFFRREFDLATFSKDQSGLTLHGFEVKGYTKLEEGKGYGPSPFGAGLDQAAVLLDQGADNSFLVLNEPDRQTKEDLKRVCEHYFPYVGLIYLSKDAVFWRARNPGMKNPYTNNDKKRKILQSLIVGGQRSDIRMTDWCEKQNF